MVRPFINTPAHTLEQRDVRRKNAIFGTCQAMVKEKLAHSTIIASPDQVLAPVPRFDRHEIVVGKKVIGRGAFAVVREITSFRLESDTPRRPSGESHKSEATAATSTEKSSTRGPRQDLADESNTKSRGKQGKYVIKELVQPDPAHWDKLEAAYIHGIVDLAMECQYLSHLNHPHILKLRGISTSNQFGGDDGMFLILEYLPETLSRRLNAWAQKDRSYKGVTGFVTRSRGRAAKFLLARVEVARDIADAMNYLHSKKIVFRDLKPDNLGFNNQDQVKMFDFGLAKELVASNLDSNGLYRNMTGFTGAIRYMAPEVGRRQRYNEKADVYSWTMLLWHIMALEPPLGLYTPNMMVDRVFIKGTRPVVKESWPLPIQHLLRTGWDQDISKRPSMEDILQILDDLIGTLKQSESL